VYRPAPGRASSAGGRHLLFVHARFYIGARGVREEYPLIPCVPSVHATTTADVLKGSPVYSSILSFAGHRAKLARPFVLPFARCQSMNSVCLACRAHRQGRTEIHSLSLSLSPLSLAEAGVSLGHPLVVVPGRHSR